MVAVGADRLPPALKPAVPLRIELLGAGQIEALLERFEVLGDLRQAAEEDRVIGPGAHQQLQQLLHQLGVVAGKSELAGPHRLHGFCHGFGKAGLDGIQLSQRFVIALQQWA